MESTNTSEVAWFCIGIAIIVVAAAFFFPFLDSIPKGNPSQNREAIQENTIQLYSTEYQYDRECHKLVPWIVVDRSSVEITMSSYKGFCGGISGKRASYRGTEYVVKDDDL